MTSLLKKHKAECITALVCGALCLAFLAPQFDSDRLRSSRFWEEWLFRETSVYQNGTGRVLLTGKSVRDAVETQLESIRRVNIKFDGEKINAIHLNKIGVLTRIRHQTEIFQDINLEGARLAQLDFRGVILAGANFAHADLSECRLEGAHLGGAHFDGANLAGAQFGPHPADLPKFNWLEADEEDIDYLRKDEEVLDRYPHTFSEASFKGATLVGATLRLSTSDAIDLKGADLTGALIEVIPSDLPDAGRLFKEVRYDEATVVQGLRLAGAIDRKSAFVQWAEERGAVVVEPIPATPMERAIP